MNEVAIQHDTQGPNPQIPLARHSLLVRVTHWVNAVAFFCLVASGIGILVAFPALYWGETGYPGMEGAWISFGIEENFDHTAWGRNIHFLFAWVLVINGLIYMLKGLLTGHVKRKLLPTRTQLKPRNIRADIWQHMRMKTHKAEEGEGYNFLQKSAYLAVIFILFPMMLLTGLTMSPAVTATFPELFTLFGGRQSARTIHFISASMLLLFFFIHIWQIFLVGAAGEIRAMITGRDSQKGADK